LQPRRRRGRGHTLSPRGGGGEEGKTGGTAGEQDRAGGGEGGFDWNSREFTLEASRSRRGTTRTANGKSVWDRTRIKVVGSALTRDNVNRETLVEIKGLDVESDRALAISKGRSLGTSVNRRREIDDGVSGDPWTNDRIEIASGLKIENVFPLVAPSSGRSESVRSKSRALPGAESPKARKRRLRRTPTASNPLAINLRLSGRSIDRNSRELASVREAADPLKLDANARINVTVPGLIVRKCKLQRERERERERGEEGEERRGRRSYRRFVNGVSIVVINPSGRSASRASPSRVPRPERDTGLSVARHIDRRKI